MELPPDPHNNPHRDRQDKIFRSGIQPIMSQGDDATLGKRKASLTAAESAKAAKIESLAQLHARRTGTPEPLGKSPEASLEPPAGLEYSDDLYSEMGDAMRSNEFLGRGPYYGNAIEWLDPARYPARYDPPRYDHVLDTWVGQQTVTRPSSANLFKDQL